MDDETTETTYIHITPQAMAKLDTYIKLVPTEVSGLGKVEKIDGELFITDVYLLEQVVSGVSTDLDTEAVSKFITDMVRKGEDPGDIKLWWHSHANMDTFWSGTDENTAERFQNGWMLCIVGNRHGKYRVRFDIYEPIRATVDRLELKVAWKVSQKEREKLEKEVSSKVSSYHSPRVHRDSTEPLPGFDPNATESDDDDFADSEFTIDGIDVFDVQKFIGDESWNRLVKAIKNKKK